MTEASGSFIVSLTPAEGGTDPNLLSRMMIEKTFHGDLEATSVGQMLAAQGRTEGSAGYVALEYVTGALSGQRGSFALQHFGVMDRGEGELKIVVVPDSGTDQLRGLTGEMDITIVDGDHNYEFSYELG